MTSPLDVRALRERIRERLERPLLNPVNGRLLRDSLSALSALEQERDRLRKVIVAARDLAESDETDTVGSAWTYLEGEIASWQK